MYLHVGNEEIKRLVDFAVYLHRHIAALEKLSGHALEIETCRRTLHNLIEKFPYLRALKDLFSRG